MSLRPRRGASAIGVAMLAVLAAAPVFAQGVRIERPYRGLFASQPVTVATSLDVRWSLTGLYDDNISADTAGFDPHVQRGGASTAASMLLTYGFKGRHSRFAAGAHSNVRYYPSLSDLDGADGGGDLSYDVDLGRHTRLAIASAAAFQPYYQFDFGRGAAPSSATPAPPSPVAPGVTAGEPGATQVSSYTLDGRVTLTQVFGPRTTGSIDYAYRYSEIGQAQRFRWQLGSGHLSRAVSRYASLRLGYGYGQTIGVAPGATGRRAAVLNQNIDLGVDYARPLSFSRRTRIGFNSGSSIVDDLGKRYYVLLLDTRVTRELGRTWNLASTYHRGVQFVEGLGAPLYANTVDLRAGGLVSRRLDVSATGGYTNGQVGLSAAGAGFTAYSAVTSARLAMTRRLSLDLEYRFYKYDFAQASDVIGGFPSALTRQGVRLGISGWIPMLHR